MTSRIPKINMATDLTCPVCGEGRLHLDQSESTTEIGGIEYKVPFHTHWCDGCASKIGLNEDLRFNARAMRQIRKKHIGLMTGEEVRACRKSLGLSQEQAAKLFGGGPVAFSKYENNEVTQSEAMDRLIWLVSKFPFLMPALADRVDVVLSDTAKSTFDAVKAKHTAEYPVKGSAAAQFANRVLLDGCSVSQERESRTAAQTPAAQAQAAGSVKKVKKVIRRRAVTQ